MIRLEGDGPGDHHDLGRSRYRGHAARARPPSRCPVRPCRFPGGKRIDERWKRRRWRPEARPPRRLPGRRLPRERLPMSSRSGACGSSTARKCAVDDVGFSMCTGEIVGLLGPNGAGKTTVFYMIVGFIQPTAGRVLLDGQRHHRPAHVQAGAARHRLPAPGALGLPQAHGRGEHPARSWRRGPTSTERRKRQAPRGAPRGIRHRRASEAEGLYPLGRRAAADRDSPGPGPRAEVPPPRRALRGHRPDRRARDQEHRPEALATAGIGVLITDHNVRDTLEITHRAHIINLGQIVVSGDRDEVLACEMARQIYLGEEFRM